MAWLAGLTASGAHRLLRRFGVRYRRGQRHVHSPDPDYDAKLAAVARAKAEAAAAPGEVALLYQDEFTYYRRPTVARAHAPAGGPGPPARQGHKGNSKRRVLGCLDALAGRLFVWQRSRADRRTLARFFLALQEAYAWARVIYVALDNWPVHFHEDVAKALAGSRVVLLRLPTYAPWTNPIEKVWRRLYEEVLHQHDFGDDWAGLQAAVTAWLRRWADGSAELLRYVGLRPD